MMKIIMLCLFLVFGGCGYSYFTVQESRTGLGSGEVVKTLVGLGFVIDHADAGSVVTEWEIYNVRPKNEVVLRVRVDKGIVRGQCGERRNVARGSTIRRPERFNESHWKFRPCTHRAGLDRIEMAVAGLGAGHE